MSRGLKGLIIASLVLGLFVITVPAQAFTISPLRYLITIEPGGEQKVSLKVKNDEVKNLVFKFSVVGIKQDSAGRPIFGTGFDEAERWLKPETDSAVIASGKEKKVDFIIKAPPGADPGAHYVGLAVEPLSSPIGQTNLAGRLVSLVSLQVAGIVQEAVLITRWQSEDSVAGDNIWNFDLQLKNTGTIEVPLTGSAIVEDWRGQKIFSTPLVLGNALLVQSVRSLKPQLILGDKIKSTGPYTVRLKIAYGRTGQNISATTSIWYLPKKSLITGGLILLFLLFLAVGWKIKKNH